MSQKTYDVVIVGGGVIGLASAYFLNRAGRSVCVLERDDVGSGASTGNAGLITPGHTLPLCQSGAIARALQSLFSPAAPLKLSIRALPGMLGWLWRFALNANSETNRRIMQARVPLMRSSRTLTEQLVKLENMQCEWAPTGVLSVCQTDAGFERVQRLGEALGEHGIETEVLDSSKLARREPALREGLVGGLVFVEDGKVHPGEFVSELARVCRERGVVIETDREVTAMNIEDSAVHSLYTKRGLFRGKHYLLANGVWSRPAARQFGLKLPVQPGKGYALTTKLPDPCPKRALVLEERSIAVTPWANSFRLAGTMEFSGLDSRPNQKRNDALLEGASQYLKEPIGRGQQQAWNGFRPMTPDDLPIIGAAPRISNVTLACGHNMMGMSMAMGTGRLVTELIAGGKPHIDPIPFDPKRFT